MSRSEDRAVSAGAGILRKILESGGKPSTRSRYLDTPRIRVSKPMTKHSSVEDVDDFENIERENALLLSNVKFLQEELHRVSQKKVEIEKNKNGIEQKYAVVKREYKSVIKKIKDINELKGKLEKKYRNLAEENEILQSQVMKNSLKKNVFRRRLSISDNQLSKFKEEKKYLKKEIRESKIYQKELFQEKQKLQSDLRQKDRNERELKRRMSSDSQKSLLLYQEIHNKVKRSKEELTRLREKFETEMFFFQKSFSSMNSFFARILAENEFSQRKKEREDYAIIQLKAIKDIGIVDFYSRKKENGKGKEGFLIVTKNNASKNGFGAIFGRKTTVKKPRYVVLSLFQNSISLYEGENREKLVDRLSLHGATVFQKGEIEFCIVFPESIGKMNFKILDEKNDSPVFWIGCIQTVLNCHT